MTTRITVTTGTSGDALLQRNAQQQAANRQGFLVKTEANEAALDGRLKLYQDRAEQGLNIFTGRPLAPSGSRLTRTKQKPAAYIQSGGLGSFFLNSQTAVGTDTEFVTTLALTSGDGSQSVSLVCPLRPRSPGDTASIPANVNTLTFTPVGDPCDFVNPGYFYAESTQIQYTRRDSLSENFRQFVFPITATTAIFVAAYSCTKRYAYVKYEFKTKEHYTGRIAGSICAVDAPIPGTYAVLVNSLNGEEYATYVESAYVKCAVVGQKVAREIQVPSLLEQAIKGAIFQETTTIQETYSDYGLSTTYPKAALDPSIVTPGFPGYLPTSGLLFAYYGITDEGANINAATPLSWIALDSFANGALLESAETHSDVLDTGVTINGQSMRDLIKPADYLGFVSSTNTLLRRTDGQYLTGSLFTKSYPYSGSGWGGTPSKLKRIDPNQSSFNRFIIYPWNIPQFCREQAAKYDVPFS